MTRILLVLMLVAVGAGISPAADTPVVVIDLIDQPATAKSMITLGDIAELRGGSAIVREQMRRIDLVELSLKDPKATISRRQIEFRLKLAEFESDMFVLRGANNVEVSIKRRVITQEEIFAVAEAALLKQMAYAEDRVVVDLDHNIAVKLPEVLESDSVSITAVPHAIPRVGLNQMDVTVMLPGGKKNSFSVFLKASLVDDNGIKPLEPLRAETRPPLVGLKGKPLPVSTETLVKVRDQVELIVSSGGLEVVASGEALQDGKMGQTIKVVNSSSKKQLTGRVTGNKQVEIDLGGN